jgi:predicted metal-dependent hydrolase
VEAFWKWHFAEEHEHRNVVANAYQSLYGRGLRAYVYRIWGLFYSMRHMNAYATEMSDILLAKDREGLNEQELAASRARAKKVRDLGKKGALKHLLAIMSPFYNSDNRSAPDDVRAILGMDKASAPIIGAASTVRSDSITSASLGAS